MTDSLADDARAIFDAGVKAADPREAVLKALRIHNDILHDVGKVHLIAVGKAACPMVEAVLSRLPQGKLGRAVAVTNYENVRQIENVQVIGASHPLPDAAGAEAAHVVEAIAGSAKASDLVLCLISGGASALLPAPVAGITLPEKIRANDLLIRSGADIVAMNTVRKALSRLKGGGLARLISPAQGVALILSDVPGDDLAIIASGPTVSDPAPPQRALEIVTGLGLGAEMPQSVMKSLEERAKSPPKSVVHTTENILVGGNAISLDAMRITAERRGYRTVILSEWLEGDVAEAAQAFGDAAQSAPGDDRIAILAGGETSVRVKGEGKGGRNQEMVLRFAVLAEANPLKRNWVFLSGGTDGRDGPTDAAGGIVTPQTLEKIAANGKPAADYLAHNDSYHALEAGNALVVTGATGTNVADLQVLLLG